MFNDILDVQYHIVQVYLLSLKRRLCFTDVCLSVCLSTGLLNKKLGWCWQTVQCSCAICNGV